MCKKVEGFLAAIGPRRAVRTPLPGVARGLGGAAWMGVGRGARTRGVFPGTRPTRCGARFFRCNGQIFWHIKFIRFWKVIPEGVLQVVVRRTTVVPGWPLYLGFARSEVWRNAAPRSQGGGGMKTREQEPGKLPAVVLGKELARLLFVIIFMYGLFCNTRRGLGLLELSRRSGYTWRSAGPL